MTIAAIRPFLKQFALVLGAWTAVALVDGLAGYWLRTSVGAAPAFWEVFRRPLAEQWIWALLTPLVFLMTVRFPLAAPQLPRSIVAHAVAFVALSLTHCVIAQALGTALAGLPAGYHGSLLKLRFLEEVYSDIWMYWPLVCIRALIDSHEKSRRQQVEAARLESLLANSQLALLRAQIQPHFLFNTLHSISTLVRTEPAGAEDLIADLAQILRASFADPLRQESSLGRELELVECYLRIQQKRFSDRLDLAYRIAPETLQAAFPPLLLQSLVENAVIHGIAPSARPGKIDISASREGPRLALQVRDDGAGLPEHFEPGLGISNARARLQRLYGDQQSLRIDQAPGGGAAVSLSIPFRIAPEAA